LSCDFAGEPSEEANLQQDLAALYAALGLPVGASLEQIEHAHRDLVKVWHPDRFGNNPRLQRKMEEKLKEINAAHDALREAFAQGYTPSSSANRASSTYQTSSESGGDGFKTAERTNTPVKAVDPKNPATDCHCCGAKRSKTDPYYDFALAKDVKRKVHWGGFAARMALNIVATPLRGSFVSAKPDSTTTATLARCRLNLCRNCAYERIPNRTGGMRVSLDDCKKHPNWEYLQQRGFSEFIEQERLLEIKLA